MEHEIALALTRLPGWKLQMCRATGVTTRVMRSKTRGFRWARLARGEVDSAVMFHITVANYNFWCLYIYERFAKCSVSKYKCNCDIVFPPSARWWPLGTS